MEDLEATARVDTAASALGAFHLALALVSKSSDKLLTLSPLRPLMPSPLRPLTLNLPSPPTLRQPCQLTANRLPSTLRLCPHIMSLASQCRDRHTHSQLRHSTASQPRPSTLSQHTPRLPSQPTLGQLRQ